MGQTAVALEGAEGGVGLGEERDVLEQAERGAGERLRGRGAHAPGRLADDGDARVRFVDVGNDAPDNGPRGCCGDNRCRRCFSSCHLSVLCGFLTQQHSVDVLKEGKKCEKWRKKRKNGEMQKSLFHTTHKTSKNEERTLKVRI